MRKYTAEELKLACSNSLSYAQVLTKLNVVAAGGNYLSLKRAIKDHKIDVSHFTGKVWNKGIKEPRKETSFYLENETRISSHKLRLRLLRDGYFEHKCTRCNLNEWQGGPIPLELEHKDGNHENNRLDNLTLLCPNCHALTLHYRGRVKKTKKTS